MTNDQFLQYYLEKQAARTINLSRLPESASKFVSRARSAFHGKPRVDSKPAKQNHPNRQPQEVTPTGTPRIQVPTVRQSPAGSELGSAGRLNRQSGPGMEGTPVGRGTQGTPGEPIRTGGDGGGTPGAPIRTGGDGAPQSYDLVPAGPLRDVTPLGYKVNRMNKWVRRNKKGLLIGGGAAGTAATLAGAGYMLSGDDAAPAPTPATATETTDPNAAPEANTPKQEDKESWWADVLAWIKENPELAMLVLGGGGLGIGALLSSR